MSDLISRSALARAMGVENAVKYGNETAEQQHNSYDTLMKYEIADYIDDAPAVDAVEVVHARWSKPFIGGYDGLHAVYYRTCSNCSSDEIDLYYNYCPNCGAKMDGGAEA